MSNLTKETIKINGKTYSVIVEDGVLTRENFYKLGRSSHFREDRYQNIINTYYFDEKRIESVDLSEAELIKIIGEMLFQDENTLKIFTFPPQLEKISLSAFSNTIIQEVILPVTVKEVADFAFYANFKLNVFVAPKACKFGENVISNQPAMFEYKDVTQAKEAEQTL